jgi:flagellar assembly protein FliH
VIIRGAKIATAAVRVIAATQRPTSAQPTALTQSGLVSPAVDPLPTPALVESWLANQDADVRNAFGVLLAPEIEAAYAAARTKGWQEGRDEALAQSRAEREAQVAVLEALAAELKSTVNRDSAVLAAGCAEIVLEVLRKIAGSTLATPQGAVGAVTQVLRRLKDAQEVVVRVRPDELEVLQTAEPLLTQALAGAKLTLVADQRVELGGCIVESKLGTLDGRLEVQLNELCETLRTAKAEASKS